MSLLRGTECTARVTSKPIGRLSRTKSLLMATTFLCVSPSGKAALRESCLEFSASLQITGERFHHRRGLFAFCAIIVRF
jgi:hypothetical protein